MNAHTHLPQLRMATDTSVSVDTYIDQRRESLLTALRCVTLQLRLLQSEADQLGIFLRNGWIDPDQAEASLVDLNLIDLAYPQIAESA